MANGTRRAWETRGEEQEFFFFSLGRKPPFDYRHRVVLDDVTVLHSPLTTFLSFFSLPPPPLPISYLAAPDIRHTFSLLSPPPLSLIFSVIRRCLFSLFAPRSQITLLYRPFERSWFGGEKSRLAAWNGTRNPLGEEFLSGRGESLFGPLSFFFLLLISIQHHSLISRKWSVEIICLSPIFSSSTSSK